MTMHAPNTGTDVRVISAPRSAGFTLTEMLVSLLVGGLLTAGALTMLNRQREVTRTESLRTELQMNARYAIDMLHRDLQQAGQGMDPTSDFGIVGMIDGTSGAADSIYMVFAESGAPVHMVKSATSTQLDLSVMCGDAVDDISVGDLVYMASGTVRGLAWVSAATRSVSTSIPCTGNPLIELGTYTINLQQINVGHLGWPLQGNIAGAAAMKVESAVYYLEPDMNNRTRLMRASSYDGNVWQGVPIADNIEDFQADLMFLDGSIGVVADGTDVLPDNDFDDINAVRVTVVAAARRTDKDIKGGQLLTHDYSITVAPRNQVYTRNLR